MAEPKKSGAFFPTLFGLISLGFLTILIGVYHFSKKANPVMLDDQGRPQQAHHP